MRGYVDALASRIAQFLRTGIEAAKKGIQEYFAGAGSMDNDTQRLAQLARTVNAQVRVSALLERGGDQGRTEFELGLPDSVRKFI